MDLPPCIAYLQPGTHVLPALDIYYQELSFLRAKTSRDQAGQAVTRLQLIVIKPLRIELCEVK